jgi:hypothetical protein
MPRPKLWTTTTRRVAAVTRPSTTHSISVPIGRANFLDETVKPSDLIFVIEQCHGDESVL